MINQFDMVAFELSNRCNYSHDKCPVDTKADPVFLPTHIINRVLDTLGWSFSGRIYFSIYNEPLIDPRLFSLIEYARRSCPNCIMELFTNGWMLNQQMVNELIIAGISEFRVSAYSRSEQDRLSELIYPAHISCVTTSVCLDDRMGIYEREALGGGSCLGPSVYLFINHRGEVALCCFDYLYTCTFGNLHSLTLEDILDTPRWARITEDLREGVRTEAVCKKCNCHGFFGGGVDA